ncbi:hypothetical protein QWZ04_03000 [Vibrio tapetis subsp. quintayensis]|uniref:hypothetical protein n=1 Tax=Vibrio tapetis TaxID=52443 RepID=UPI0025B5BAEB|nr:hypothetical protein [Vibrio tapetis]MDN3679295.1 hypothetical protein [Vibrio tapetis subsp. quintayensis]
MIWQELIALIFVVEIIVLLIVIIWATPIIVDEIQLRRRRNKFGEKLSSLFVSNKLDTKQIDILAKEYLLNSKDIQLATRKQFKEALGVDNPESMKVEYFQKLFEKYESDEPFEGLPSEVRFHLEKVREVLTTQHEDLLRPLASKLQELNEENTKKQKRMWWVSLASLLVGLISLLFATFNFSL